MATYTEAEIQAFYDASKASYLACLNSKEYSIKDRDLKREDLKTLQAEMDKWKTKLEQVQNGESTTKKKVSLFVPLDC